MNEQEIKDAIVREAMWWWEMIRPFAGPSPRWVDVIGDAEERRQSLGSRALDLAAELDELERARGHGRWSEEDLAEIKRARGRYQDELPPATEE
jgi:hypothetical protein